MDVVIAFLLTIFLSFWGSLQLGLVNVKVIQTALKYGMQKALNVAMGGSLPEVIYAGLALLAAAEISRHENLIKFFGYLMIPVFMGLGIYYLTLKSKPVQPNDKPAGFKTGFLLGMVNPQLILYWTLMFLYIRKWVPVEGIILKVFLSIGAAVGAFLALWMFAALAISKKDFILTKSGHKIEKIIGMLFIALAIWEIASKFF